MKRAGNKTVLLAVLLLIVSLILSGCYDRRGIERKERYGMTLKELAEKLDGTMEYPSMSKDIVKAAAESGIVIVHGCSDDLIEFEGAIRDEAGCFDGGKVYFNKTGFLEEGSAGGRLIKVFWDGQCEDEKRPFEATWEYETDISHETFRMLDEEELYCKGIVFYLKDIDRKDQQDD